MGIVGAIRRLARRQFAMVPAELDPRAQIASNRTSLDRYPELFKAVAIALPAARRILSYGCSTGEECATLSGYFRNADIVGADINLVNLALARRRCRFGWPQIEFVHSDDPRLTLLAPFDAIFGMSVLRIPHGHKSRAIAAKYPFARFEEQVAFLDDLLAAGGLLVLHRTTYRFYDTALAARYEVIPVAYDCKRERPARLPGGDIAGIYREKLFRKLIVR